MTTTEARPRIVRLYRVRSVHEIKTVAGKVKTYTRTRHFLTKHYALRSYNRLVKEKENWESPLLKDTFVGGWGKPLSVQFSESEPVNFPDDYAEGS